MAYVNVKDWSVDQVTEWIKGLDNVVLPYAKSFLNNGVTGYQLLNLRADDLEHLGVVTLGHQEIILEAVELLRNFHFELDRENLQMLALRLSCAANSLYKELLLMDDNCTTVQTQTMSDVHNIINTIKPLACWLDRSPFRGDKDYTDKKTQLLELSFEMATSAHRDRFSEHPNRTIRNICELLAKMADSIIQDVCDPMILQPASLDLATLKKKEQELGFFIMPNNHAVHQIAEIKYGSPAHTSSKIEEGDEIVQVNYQTVVGWQPKKVMMLLQESPPEIVLTLKKRPRHTKVYGQIYMKPYRLPSKKRSQPYSRWNENLPSPRPLAIQLPIPKLPQISEPQELTETSSSSDSETPDSPLEDGCMRMYPLKPRPVLQRRNTITGATPTNKRSCPDIEQYWQLLRNQAASAHSSAHTIDKFCDDSKFFRDKSASCSHGLELTPRPSTVIGLSQNRNASLKNQSFKSGFSDEKPVVKKHVNFEDIRKNDNCESEKVENKTNIDQCESQITGLSPLISEERSLSVNSLSGVTDSIAFIDEGRDITDRTSMAAEVINESVNIPPSGISSGSITAIKDAALADVHIQNIIKKFDEQRLELPKPDLIPKPKILPRTNIKISPEVPQRPDTHKKPAVPARSANTKLRGRLDKSHSTPAYDLSPEDDVPSPVEKLVFESKQAAEKKVEKETVVTATITIERHDANVVELTNEALQHVEQPLTKQIIKQTESIKNVHGTIESSEAIDVPPKPPPRTFPPQMIQDVRKSEVSKSLTVSDPSQLDSPRSSRNIEHVEHKPLIPDETIKTTNKSGIVKTQEPMTAPQPVTAEQSVNIETGSGSTFKHERHDFADVELSNTVKSALNIETGKANTDLKVSPTNSVVRAMIYSNKNKGTNKKKHSLMAKRRKVSIADLNGGDMQGYLHQRLRNKHTSNFYWERRWLVLCGNCLYAFKNKDSVKASCLIFLSGFTVAVASEVKSRSYAFKVYHTGTAFYFSADNQESLSSWMDLITSATMHHDPTRSTESLYSETDESDTDKSKTIVSEKPPETFRKFGSLKKFTTPKKHDSPSNGSTSLDRKWFFHKSNTNSKNSVPVPTAQFRSYRKIKNSSPNSESISTGNFTSHVPVFASRLEIPSLSQIQNISVPNLVDHVSTKASDEEKSTTSAKMKTRQKNFIHASNPSLCNASEFLPNFSKPHKYQQGNENLAGFVTLEELMNRQTEERRLNPHCVEEETPINLNLIRPDVVYGEVPIRPSEKADVPQTSKKTHTRTASDSVKHIDKEEEGSSSCFGKRSGSLKKTSKEELIDNRMFTYPKGTKYYEFKHNRSLPRTHKIQENRHQQSYDSCIAEKVPSASSVEPFQLKEHSYEMIYCPETTADVHYAQNMALDGRMYQDTSKRPSKVSRQYSFTSSDKKETRQHPNKSEESLLFKKGAKVGDLSMTKVRLKSAGQYTPVSLPISDTSSKSSAKFAFELSLDEKSSKSSKFKFFSKQTDSKKEKTFLGSPKLGRTIFRKANQTQANRHQDSQHKMQTAYNGSLESFMVPGHSEKPRPFVCPHTDYPGLEYPPVFEPETYSLADPQSSLTILRKQTKTD